MLALDAVLEVELVLEFEADFAPKKPATGLGSGTTPNLAIRFWRKSRRQGACDRMRRGCVDMWVVKKRMTCENVREVMSEMMREIE